MELMSHDEHPDLASLQEYIDVRHVWDIPSSQTAREAKKKKRGILS